MSIGWKLHEGTLGPHDVVAPDERLSWPKTVGLGARPGAASARHRAH